MKNEMWLWGWGRKRKLLRHTGAFPSHSTLSGEVLGGLRGEGQERGILFQGKESFSNSYTNTTYLSMVSEKKRELGCHFKHATSSP